MSKTSTSLAKGTFKEICRLRRDNFSVGDFSIMTDSAMVWIDEQKSGEQQKQIVEIPRTVFNQLLKQYQKEQPFIRKSR